MSSCVLPCPTVAYRVQPCPTMSYHVLPCPTVSYRVLLCPTVSYRVLLVFWGKILGASFFPQNRPVFPPEAARVSTHGEDRVVMTR